MYIRDVVQQAFNTGWITLEAEEQLRSLLSAKYELDDLRAFMLLQAAAMTGTIRQESRLPRPLDVSEIMEMSSF